MTTRVPTISFIMVLVALMSWASTPSGAATDSTRVSVDVLKSTTISNQCTSAAATEFGTHALATTEQTLLTETNPASGICRFQFGASNTTATARIFQRDRDGAAMESENLSVLEQIEYGPPRDLYFDMVSDTDGFKIKSNGQIYRTDTSGASWTAEDLLSNSLPLGMTAVDDVKAYALTASTTSQTTQLAVRNAIDDGSWDVRPLPSGFGYGSALAFDTEPGKSDFVVVNVLESFVTSSLWRSNDAGQTWDSIEASPTHATSLAIRDGHILLSTADASSLRYSADEGDTWETIPTGIASGAISNLTFVDDPVDGMRVWFHASDFGIYRSAVPFDKDDPQFELAIAKPAGCGLTDMSIPNPDTVYVYSTCEGHRRTTDATAAAPITLDAPGTTDVSISVRIDATSTNHAFGLAPGAWQVTTNGTDWTTPVTDVGTLKSITTRNLNHVMLGDELGNVFVSSNAGVSWTPTYVGEHTAINRIIMTGEDDAYALGENGTLYVTTDSGANWEPRLTGSSATRHMVVARNGAILVNGTAFRRSEDGGLTWKTVTGAPASSPMVLEPLSGTVWTRNWFGGTLHRSTDHGRTWVNLPTFGTSTQLAAAAGAVWKTVGTNLLRSTDDGMTWQSQPLPDGGAADLAAIDAEHVLVASTYFLQPSLSTDAGATWRTSTSTPGFFQSGGIRMVDPSTFYLFVSNTLYKSTPAAAFPDYATGAWNGDESFFGMCLQRLGAGTDKEAFDDDSLNTPENCTGDEGDPWYGLPNTPTSIASTNTSGATGEFDLVFGLMIDSNQESGRYHATFNVEVVAPQL